MNDPITNDAAQTWSTGSVKQLVFSLHGIETDGAWQKSELGRVISENDFIYEASNYGRFRVFKFVIPYFREKKITWFLKEYETNARGLTRSPSIIAHSFGTFLVAEVLDRFEHVKFDRIIFCGSIVRKNYDWTAKIKVGQCNAVHNDHGGLDFWAWIVKRFIRGACDSGVTGFSDEAGGAVSQIYYSRFHHSDYFFRSNYRLSWLPFLKGGQAHRLTPNDLRGEAKDSAFNWTMIALAVVATGILIIAGWFFLSPARPEADTITFEQLIEDHRDKGFLESIDKYKAAHEGKQIEWDVVIQEKLPNGYIIIPVDSNLSDFRVMATLDSRKSADWLKVGNRVKIRAIIDDINPSTVRLKNLTLVDRK